MPVSASAAHSTRFSTDFSKPHKPCDLHRLRERIVKVSNTLARLEVDLRQARNEHYTPSPAERLRQVLRLGSGYDPNPKVQHVLAEIHQQTHLAEQLISHYQPLAVAEAIRDNDRRIVQAQKEGTPTDDLLAQEETLKVGLALDTLRHYTDASLPFVSLLEPHSWLGLASTAHRLARLAIGRSADEPSVALNTQAPRPRACTTAAGTSRPTQACKRSPAGEAYTTQRAHADTLIDTLAARMPERGFLPAANQQGAVFALLSQLPRFPAEVSIRLHDARGQLKSVYQKDSATVPLPYTIDLQVHGNGNYSYLDGAQSPQPNQDPLELIVNALPSHCELGKGGDFPGANTPAGRVVTLREQIARFAEDHREALLDDLTDPLDQCRATPRQAEAAQRRFLPFWKAGCGERRTALHDGLALRYPEIPSSRLDEVLNKFTFSDEQRRAYEHTGRIPQALARALDRARRQERAERAIEAIARPRTYDPNADRLVRHLAQSALASMNRNLVIQEPGMHPFVANGTSDSTVVLNHRGNGRYEAVDLRNGGSISSIRDSDSLFQALGATLQPHERLQLGMRWENDIAGTRQWFASRARTLMGCTASGIPPLDAPSTKLRDNDLGQGLRNLQRSRLLDNAQGQNNAFSGVGRFYLDRPCTAFLIDTTDSTSPPNASAFALTNGHCVDVANGRIITNQTLVDGTVEFNLFRDTQPVSVAVDRVEWSSMNGVDLAVLRLKEPLAQLRVKGITPLLLTDTVPADGSDILVVGAPTDLGRPMTVRMAACTQQSANETEAEDGAWVWRHSVVNHCRDVSGGSSGSPILNRNTGEVFAVINSAGEQNQGISLGQLVPCFTGGELVDDPGTCPLFPVFSITVPDLRSPRLRYAKVATLSDGSEQIPRWNFSFGIDTPYYRYKTVAQSCDCESEAGYSAPLPADRPMIHDRMEHRIGVQKLCIVGVDDAAGTLAQGTLRNALTVNRILQPAGPAQPPEVAVRRLTFRGQTGYQATWSLDPVQHREILSKSGPGASTDCADPSGYQAGMVPLRRVSSDMLPYTICNVGVDHAGQQSQPVTTRLP